MPTLRSLRLLPVVLACTLVLAAAGSSAQTTVVAGSHALATGFFDDSAFGSPDAPVWFRRAVVSGTSVVRLEAEWSTVAPKQPADATNPADPVYRWAALDREVEEATAAGLAPGFRMR